MLKKNMVTIEKIYEIAYIYKDVHNYYDFVNIFNRNDRGCIASWYSALGCYLKCTGFDYLTFLLKC